jgi:hypothetical protein
VLRQVIDMIAGLCSDWDGRLAYDLLVKDAAVRSSRFSRERMFHATKH